MNKSANIIQLHIMLSFGSALGLEEDGFAMFAFGTRMFFRPWKRGITNNIRNNIGQFIHFVHNFVDINAIVIGNLLVIAISTCVKQNLVLFIFFWVKYVVAFLTKTDADKTGSCS